MSHKNQEVTPEEHLEGIETFLQEANPQTLFSVEFVKGQLTGLLGPILTIIDAAVVDPVQRKAVKDLVKQKIFDQLQWVVEYSIADHIEGKSEDGTMLKWSPPSKKSKTA